MAVSKSVASKQIRLLKNLHERTCLETTWNCTAVHWFRSQACCVMPAEDAHVLWVASLERQRGSAACPSPPHHRAAGTGPSRERCPLLSQISQLNPAAPKYSLEMQMATGSWSPSTERDHQQNSLGYRSGRQLQHQIKPWDRDCLDKMLHFAANSLAHPTQGKSSAFHRVWIRSPTFNTK